MELRSLYILITNSTAIVRGKVLTSYTATEGPMIYTHYRVQVSETLKGSAAGPVDVRFPGGVANNLRQNFAGVPQFNAGDEFVFFLWTGKAGATQALGLTQGLFAVAADGSADRLPTRSASHEVMLDHSTGKQV